MQHSFLCLYFLIVLGHRRPPAIATTIVTARAAAAEIVTAAEAAEVVATSMRAAAEVSLTVHCCVEH